MVKIEAYNLKKQYGNNIVFSNLNLLLQSPAIYGIAGKNGSGKSTLLKILCGLLSPSEGEIRYYISNSEVSRKNLFKYFSFIAPYAALYEELSLEETVALFAKIKRQNIDRLYLTKIIEDLNLKKFSNQPLRHLSTGLRQRAKIIIALAMKPLILFLDEPTSNLDEKAKAIFREIINEYSKHSLTIIASNEKSDLVNCKEIFNLDEVNKL